MIHLYETSKIVKLIETKSRMAIAKSWQERKIGSYYSMGVVSVIQDDQVLEILWMTFYI